MMPAKAHDPLEPASESVALSASGAPGMTRTEIRPVTRLKLRSESSSESRATFNVGPASARATQPKTATGAVRTRTVRLAAAQWPAARPASGPPAGPGAAAAAPLLPVWRVHQMKSWSDLWNKWGFLVQPVSKQQLRARMIPQLRLNGCFKTIREMLRSRRWKQSDLSKPKVKLDTFGASLLERLRILVLPVIFLTRFRY